MIIEANVPALTLTWNTETLKEIFSGNGIKNRSQLAQAIPTVARAVIYRSLSEDWAGRATATLIAHISSRFSTPVGSLVTVKENI